MQVLVGGETAIFDDFATVLTSKLPLFIGIVVLLSFLLLMAVFRSLLIPLDRGGDEPALRRRVVRRRHRVFQWGWGASLFGIDKTGPIEAFLPGPDVRRSCSASRWTTRCSSSAGSTRSGIAAATTREAVTHGLAATGRTITAAATIMVLVFGSFILGGSRIIDLFGVGLASAVLLDALIVRSVLVPAAMMLSASRTGGCPLARAPSAPAGDRGQRHSHGHEQGRGPCPRPGRARRGATRAGGRLTAT